MTELIERYQDYRARSPPKGQVNHPSVGSNATWDANETMRSDWNFDTIKTMSALGTFRGTINDLSMPPGMVMEGDDESLYDDTQSSIDTGAATKGSDPIVPAAMGMNSEAAHSTVIIKPIRTQDPQAEEPSGTVVLYSHRQQHEA